MLASLLALAAAANPHLPTALELARPGMQAIAPDVWVAPLAERTWVISFTHLLDDKTVYPANAIAVDTPDGAVLIDPGWEPAQTEAILKWARATLRHPVKEAIITHSHADRSAGIGVLRKEGIPALGLARTAQILEAQHQPGPSPLAHLDERPWTGPGGIEVRHPGPGHAPDNLVVWIPWAKVLYGGCFVKSVTAKTLGNLEDADVKSWPGAMKRVLAAYPDAVTVIPGHGTLEGDSLHHTLALLTPAIDPARAAQYFAEAKAASDADAGRLWGVRMYGPMLFVDPRSRTVVANQADAEGRLKRDGAVWTGTIDAGIGIANTAARWAGVSWTMVRWDAPGQFRQDRVRLMMHECFHRVQDGIGLPMNDAVSNHLDTMDGRIWLQLEWRALDRALRSQGAQRKEALADALAFRTHRRALIPAAAQAENALERNEGLAEYTGVALAAGTPAERGELAEIGLREAHLKRTFVRSFAYVSGPAYGLLLDAARPAWRRAAKGSFDLGELVRVAYRLAPAAHAEERAKRYDGAEIVALEQAREEMRQRALAEARKKFIDGHVLVLKPVSRLNYSFNPNDVIAVDEHSTVYPGVKVSDEWGALTAEGGAMLVREKDGIARVVVPAPAAGATRGDGWELELKPGWKIVPAGRPGDYQVERSGS